MNALTGEPFSIWVVCAELIVYDARVFWAESLNDPLKAFELAGSFDTISIPSPSWFYKFYVFSVKA